MTDSMPLIMQHVGRAMLAAIPKSMNERQVPGGLKAFQKIRNTHQDAFAVLRSPK